MVRSATRAPPAGRACGTRCPVRSLGDGQVDFAGIFSKLTQYGFEGWAVMEWECCIKSGDQGAAEGAPFIARHIIQAAGRAFDDFAGSGSDQAANRRMLGVE